MGQWFEAVSVPHNAETGRNGVTQESLEHMIYFVLVLNQQYAIHYLVSVMVFHS